MWSWNASWRLLHWNEAFWRELLPHPKSFRETINALPAFYTLFPNPSLGFFFKCTGRVDLLARLSRLFRKTCLTQLLCLLHLRQDLHWHSSRRVFKYFSDFPPSDAVTSLTVLCFENFGIFASSSMRFVQVVGAHVTHFSACSWSSSNFSSVFFSFFKKDSGVILPYSPWNSMTCTLYSSVRKFRPSSKSAVMKRARRRKKMIDRFRIITCVHPFLWRIALKLTDCALIRTITASGDARWTSFEWTTPPVNPKHRPLSSPHDPQCLLSCWSGSPWESGILMSNLDGNIKTWGFLATYAFDSSRLFRMNRELDNDLIREKEDESLQYYASLVMSIRP